MVKRRKSEPGRFPPPARSLVMSTGSFQPLSASAILCPNVGLHNYYYYYYYYYYYLPRDWRNTTAVH